MIYSNQAEFITVVSGLPRSGTSLMMQMLAAGGLPILTDDRRPPDENNPRGYLEFEPVKRLRLDQTWLPRANGHALKIIHLLLPELPSDGRFAYRVLFMRRPLDDVLKSQRTMLERQGKISVPNEALKKAYQSQLDQAETWMASHDCVRHIGLGYHRVLTAPFEVAKEVSAFLEKPLDVEKMAAVVDPNLCHYRSD